MRLGNLIIGFLLAIAVAYVHDTAVPASSPDGQPQNLVNWEVFGRMVSTAGQWVRTQVDDLADQVHGRD